MKYLQLFESWNPLSNEGFAEARKLHKIGVFSDQELADLNDLKISSKRILDYKGVGDLNLSYTILLTGLPQGLKVGANLGLTACTGLESLPAGLVVRGGLRGCTSLESVSADLVVKDYLDLSDCDQLKSLPAGLKVGGSLCLNQSTGLESLPADLVVDGDLDLGGCNRLKSLPADLKIGGKIYR